MERANRITVALDKIAEWSIYLMIFCLPFSKSIIEITIVTALASVIIKKIITKERFLTSDKYINILLFIFVALTLPSLLNSANIGLSVRALFSKTLKFAALFLITKEIINTREKLNNFVIMAILSCAIILADGFAQYFITHRDVLRDYQSFKYVCYNGDTEVFSFIGFPTACFPFPNDFAAWILMFIFPAGIFILFGRKGWLESAISVALFISLFYFLVLTKARGAWLGFLASLGLLSIFKIKKAGILFFGIVLLSGIFFNRSLIPEVLSVASISDRSTMWTNGWNIFREHPVIGNGLNTFYLNYTRVRSDNMKDVRGSYAHNCYLQMAAETGLVGLASFIIFIAAVIFKAFKSIKSVKDPLYYSLIMGIALGLVAFLAHSFVDTNLYSLNLAALFWLSAGIMLAVVKIAESGR